MKKSLLLISIMSIFVACENNDGETTSNERRDITLTSEEQVVSEKCTDLAFNFFNQINLSETERPNWMISPLSLSYALSMLANGADNNTLNEIKAVLDFSNSTMDDVNNYNKRLTEALVKLDNQTQIGIANSIWLDNEFPVLSEFVDINKEMFDAEVMNVEMAAPETPKNINQWCADKTNNYINEIFKEDETSEYKYILMNALYFKGSWSEKFDKEETQLEEFTNNEGKTSLVYMMNNTDDLYCKKYDNLSIAELPYGNKAYSMVIILPNEDETLDNVLSNCTDLRDKIDEFIINKSKDIETYKREISLKLPRFELKYEKDVIETLKQMGMKDAFDAEKADFSKISSKLTYITKAIQKTYLKVDEEGSEAAAVTVFGGMESSPGPSLTSKFHVNRPFAFLIKEESTGTILFMGKVTQLP